VAQHQLDDLRVGVIHGGLRLIGGGVHQQRGSHRVDGAERVAPLVQEHHQLLVGLARLEQLVAIAAVEQVEMLLDRAVLGDVVKAAHDDMPAQHAGDAEAVKIGWRHRHRLGQADHEIDVLAGLIALQGRQQIAERALRRVLLPRPGPRRARSGRWASGGWLD
jgi:hypothetical protein